MDNPNLQAALSFANKLLAKREYATLEMRKKLLQKKFATADIEATMAHLRQSDLICDKRFGAMYVRNNSTKFGDDKIIYNLSNLGLDDDLIEELLKSDEIDDELTRAFKIMEKRFSHPLDDSHRHSIHAFLKYRGFSAATIDEVIKKQTFHPVSDTDD